MPLKNFKNYFVATQKAFSAFVDNLHASNPHTNIHHDFFAAKFKRTQISIIQKTMATASFSIYPMSLPSMWEYPTPAMAAACILAYWGVTKNGEVCSLVIDFKVN